MNIEIAHLTITLHFLAEQCNANPAGDNAAAFTMIRAALDSSPDADARNRLWGAVFAQLKTGGLRSKMHDMARSTDKDAE